MEKLAALYFMGLVSVTLLHNVNGNQLISTDEEIEETPVEPIDYVSFGELNLDHEIFFDCSWNTKCVCNGDETHVDCSGNELDEFPGMSSFPKQVQILNMSRNSLTEITPHSLDHLTQLKILDLSSNDISTLSQHTFKNLSNLCELNLANNQFRNWVDLSPNTLILNNKNLKRLDLSHNNLSTLVLDSHEMILSDSLETLILEDCNIKAINGKSPVGGLSVLHNLLLGHNPLTKLHGLISPSLRNLDLSFCKLDYIHHTELLGLPSLTHLNLSHNYRLILFTKLGKLTSESLQYLDLSHCNLDHINLSGFQRLQKALLSDNMIRLSYVDDFTNSSHLEYVDLSSNSISILNSNSLLGLNLLKFLNLSYNTISKIPEDLFIATPNLKKVILSKNYLKSLSSMWSSTLEELDVSNCEIEHIDSNSLEYLPKLVDLNLSRNLLRQIPDKIRANSLKYLDFSYNRLSIITNNTFSMMPRLNYINLSSNRFTFIFCKSFFEKNPFLMRLDLTDNIWRCECREKEFREFFEYLVYETNMREDPEQLLCQSPQHLSGLSWQEACIYSWSPQNDNFDGPRVVTTTVVLIVCFLIGVFIMVTIRRLMQSKLETLNREREQQIEEARERLRILRMRHDQEAQCNAPDPRDLVSPPSYAEAILLPKIDGSVQSLSELGERRKKKRRSRKAKSTNDVSDPRPNEVSIDLSSDDSGREDLSSKRHKRRSRKIGSNEIRPLENSPRARRRLSEVVTIEVDVEPTSIDEAQSLSLGHHSETFNND